MFSFDNFLIDNMPVKSRFMYDKFCDPQLAYWPDDFYLCRPRKRKNTTRNLYNRFINGLIDEILDPNNQSDIEMEIEYEPKKKQLRKQLDEKSNYQEINKTECSSTKEALNCDRVKSVKEANQKEVADENRNLQLAKPTEINLRLSNYKPEEISVNVKDGRLTISGKKEHKDGSSYSCQTFKRTFTLPENCDLENIKCQMDSKGSIKLNLPHKQQAIKQDATEGEIKIIREENEEKDDNKKEETSIKTVDDEPKVEDLVEP